MKNNYTYIFLLPNSETQCPLSDFILCVAKPFSYATLILPQCDDLRTINIINLTPGAKIFIKTISGSKPFTHIGTNEHIQVTLCGGLCFISFKRPVDIFKTTVTLYHTPPITRDYWITGLITPTSSIFYKVIKVDNTLYAVGDVLCILKPDGSVVSCKKINVLFKDIAYHDGYFYFCGTSSSGAIIGKLDSNFTSVWVEKCNSFFSSFVSVLISSENDGVYVYAAGRLDLYSLLITKWNLNGSLLWAKTISVNHNAGFCKILRLSNDIYTIGSERIQYGSSSYVSVMISKFTLDGTLQSCKILTTSGLNLQPRDACLAVENGNEYIYVVGESYPDYSHLVLKYSLNGSIVWQKRAMAPGYFTSLKSVFFSDASGTVYTTGNFFKLFPVLQFSSDGDLLFSRFFVTPTAFDATYISLDDSIYVCGSMQCPQYINYPLIMKLPLTFNDGYFPEMPDILVTNRVYDTVSPDITVQTGDYTTSDPELNFESYDIQYLSQVIYPFTASFTGG